MKRGILISLILGFILIASLSFVVAEITCTETDDGKDYEEKGTLTIANSTNSTDFENMTDSCSDNMTLLEYSCDGLSIDSQEKNCRYGCEDGACLTISCGAEHLTLCWDENPCINAGGHWYDFGCHEETEAGGTNSNESNETKNNESNSTPKGLGQMIRRRIRAGIYTNAQGEQIRVSELARNRIRFIVENIEAETELEIEEVETENNKSKLKAILANGRKIEIKIMPHVASRIALARLKLKLCNKKNNCTIELKELAEKRNKNQSRLIYEIQRERHFKLLGLFRRKAQVKAQIDAETGEIISIKKPWWAFLATEPEEKSVE